MRRSRSCDQGKGEQDKGRTIPSCSSGPTALAASSSPARWTRGAFARRLTMGSGGSGEHGSLKRRWPHPRGWRSAVSPGVPRPGEDVTIRARIRRTELDEARGPDSHPRRSRATRRRGRRRGHRFACGQPPSWAFSKATSRRRRRAPTICRSCTATGASVDEVVVVDADARHAIRHRREPETALRLIAASTGGVAVTTADLAPLERTCAGCRAGKSNGRSARPGRWPWSIVFATLLCAEWGIRRRRRSEAGQGSGAGSESLEIQQGAPGFIDSQMLARVQAPSPDPDPATRDDRHLHHLPPRRAAHVAEHRRELRARSGGARGVCRGAQHRRSRRWDAGSSRRLSAA